LELRIRDPGSRKGDNGRLLVIGGSSRYFGAPALASLAAMRAGTDLVYTIVPEFIAPTVASYSPDLIVWSYEGKHLSKKALALIEEIEPKIDALLIGNGLGREKEALRTAKTILDSWEKPAVIDADPIGFVNPKPSHIFTPHDGEFERLTGKKVNGKPESERIGIVKSEAARMGAVILLKGPTDIISDGKIVHTSSTGNPGMTCGGTGDTLAGLAGAFLSQDYGLVESARLASYFNGKAGTLAFNELGYSMRASDIINFIGKAMKNSII